MNDLLLLELVGGLTSKARHFVSEVNGGVCIVRTSGSQSDRYAAGE